MGPCTLCANRQMAEALFFTSLIFAAQVVHRAITAGYGRESVFLSTNMLLLNADEVEE